MMGIALDRPLSDDQLAELLQLDGIAAARYVALT
jgi:DNA-directed RNA polymerase specialized sigma54-like protein